MMLMVLASRLIIYALDILGRICGIGCFQWRHVATTEINNTKWQTAENSKIQTSFPLAASSAVSKATIYLQEYGPAKANLLNGFVKLNDILTHAKLEHDSWHVLSSYNLR